MGRKNEEWLRKYLELPHGIPSWSTIRRVFDFIDPKQFEKCFCEWMKEVTQISMVIRRVHALLDKDYLHYILSINFG